MSASYSTQLEALKLAVEFDEKKCGPITVSFSTPFAFLKHDAITKSVSLTGDTETVQGNFSGAELTFSADSTWSWKLPIHAVFSPCELSKVSFE